MRLSEVPWSDLRVGQKVQLGLKPPLDGVIVRLERAPMIWISWDDGNRHEYIQSILGHVEVLDEAVGANSEFTPTNHLGWTDAEGE